MQSSLQGHCLQARVSLRLLLHVQAEMCGAKREGPDAHSLRFSPGCVSASFAIQADVMWCGNLCSRIFSDALHHSVCPDPIPLPCILSGFRLGWHSFHFKTEYILKGNDTERR